jgi:hypothetical protein
VISLAAGRRAIAHSPEFEHHFTIPCNGRFVVWQGNSRFEAIWPFRRAEVTFLPGIPCLFNLIVAPEVRKALVGERRSKPSNVVSEVDNRAFGCAAEFRSAEATPYDLLEEQSVSFHFFRSSITPPKDLVLTP